MANQPAYVTIRVPDETKRELEKIALREDRTVSKVALRFLLKGMKAK